MALYKNFDIFMIDGMITFDAHRFAKIINNSAKQSWKSDIRCP